MLRKLDLKRLKAQTPAEPPLTVAVAPETIGERIKRLRNAKPMTQAALAELVGMQRSDLSDLERGQHDPRFEKLRRIARGLGVPLAELVNGLDLTDS